MSKLIVLPTPQPSSTIVLGQLITNPFDLSSKPTIQYPNKHSRHQNTIAEDGKISYTCLTQPRATFNTFRRDAAAQAFFRQPGLQRQPLYYVTGIQTLNAPSSKRAVVGEGSVTEAPASEFRLPMHVRRVDSASNLDNTSSVHQDKEETVFAVELVKVKCRVGAANEPHDMEDIDYEWTYHSLDDDDLQLSIGLGKVMEAAEFRTLAGMADDENLTDASWDSRSEDDGDDGLGGF